MIIRPFESEDLERLILQPDQIHLKPLLSGKGYGQVLAAGEALTCIEGGRIIGCGGIVILREGLGNIWTMLTGDIHHKFVLIHRITKRFLEASTVQRIEAHVDCDFEAGHRWMKLLGFELEAPCMRKFTTEGKDAALYARIRS